jgi:hypothetical protein
MRTRPRSRAAEAAPLLRISSPESLFEAIPYLLGFHPEASLVLVGLDDSQLVVTVRIDLADLADPVAARLLPDAIAAMVRGGASSLVGAVYLDDELNAAVGEQRRQSWVDALADLTGQAAAAGCRVLDVFVAHRGQWWSGLCPPSTDTGGHVRSRRLLPNAVSDVSAAATYAGLVALPDRAALAAVLDPAGPEHRAGLEPLIADAEASAVQAVLDGGASRADRSLKRAIFAAARSSEHTAETPWSPPTDDEVARFGVALSAVGMRDAVWMAIDDRRLDGRALWRDLSRRLPTPYDAAPLFLFGWCSWRAGNGALASIAAQRAIESDPGYSAADILLAALSRGVDPRRLPRLRTPRSG